jgi:hypothetical protein
LIERSESRSIIKKISWLRIGAALEDRTGGSAVQRAAEIVVRREIQFESVCNTISAKPLKGKESDILTGA